MHMAAGMVLTVRARACCMCMCMYYGRYMAPEMKAKEPYNHSVDWYSLGKLIVDCQGRNPYAEETRFWETSGLLDLVEGLLHKTPTKRLGCGADGVASIQRHRFFATTDWKALNAKKVESPQPSPLNLHRSTFTLTLTLASP